MKIEVDRFLTNAPDDLAGLEGAVAKKRVDPSKIVCVIGKTEGDGGMTDPTRTQAVAAFERFFEKHCGWKPEATHEKVVLSFSGGCEGVVTPHVTVFSRFERKIPVKRQRRLGLAIGHTRAFRPEEIGRMPQIEETAAVVKRLIAEAGLEEVHLVQAKGAIPAGGDRSNMVYSRGATALGIALGAGEIRRSQLGDDPVCRQWELYSGVASCSAKPDLPRTELVVLGNGSRWTGDLAMRHAVLRDILDVETLTKLVKGREIVALFAKAEADPSGRIRGRRHTMLTDPVEDIRWSRCVLGAVIASVIDDTAIYVSTRAEHHGPPGGGPVAIIERV